MIKDKDILALLIKESVMFMIYTEVFVDEIIYFWILKNVKKYKNVKSVKKCG